MGCLSSYDDIRGSAWSHESHCSVSNVKQNIRDSSSSSMFSRSFFSSFPDKRKTIISRPFKTFPLLLQTHRVDGRAQRSRTNSRRMLGFCLKKIMTSAYGTKLCIATRLISSDNADTIANVKHSMQLMYGTSVRKGTCFKNAYRMARLPK